MEHLCGTLAGMEILPQYGFYWIMVRARTQNLRPWYLRRWREQENAETCKLSRCCWKSLENNINVPELAMKAPSSWTTILMPNELSVDFRSRGGSGRGAILLPQRWIAARAKALRRLEGGYLSTDE